MKALEHRVPPPVVVLVIGGTMWALARYTPHLAMDGAMRLGLAGCLLVVGLGFLSGGFFAFRRARTTIDPVKLDHASALVITGIYRVSRNPMYVGFTALLAAWAVALAAPWTLLGVIAFVAFTRQFQILPEERVLRAKFGAPYEAYLEKVRRWI